MIGPSAPVSNADQFAQTLAAYERRIADLERASARSIATGSRNLLDNGAMNICQRATSITGVATDAGQRVVDRWVPRNNAQGTYTYNQVADGPAGTEFSKCVELLCTTADAAPAAGDFVFLQEAIEGLNVQHLLYGTAAAKVLTLSFWVKSNLVGNYVAELVNIGAASRTIAAAFTVNVSGVWEIKTLRFVGDTTQALTNDNAGRLFLSIWAGAGSTYTGGASLQTTWGTTTNQRAFGVTNLSATINNYIRVTGVQLEVGSIASPFESRRFDDELQRCRRYYWKSFQYAVAPAQNVDNTNGQWLSTQINTGAGAVVCKGYHRFSPPMRATPTVITYNPNAANANFRNSGDTVDFAITAITVTADGLDFRATAVAVADFGKIHATATADI